MTKLIPAFLHQRDPAEIERRLSDTVYCAGANERGFEILGGKKQRGGKIPAPPPVPMPADN